MTNELYHHGILGMRWGVRRYQNADGSLTAAGKKRRLKDQKNAEAAKARAENRKQAVIRSGSVQDVKKYQSSLTNDELRQAVERIDMNRRLDDIDQRRKDDAVKAVQRVSTTVNSAATFASNSIKIYNALANVRNTFTSKETKWKTIPGAEQSSKKKKP